MAIKLFNNYYLIKDRPRPFIRYALRNLKGDKLIGAEIGVYKGDNALQMIKTGRISKIYLIDPYKVSKKYKDYLVGDLKETKSIAKRRLDYSMAKKIWIYKDSVDAIREIKDKLDFVYVDGDHSYEQVGKDIYFYWDLIRNRGVIGGHDFCYHANLKGHGVIQAVIEFCAYQHLKLYVESPDWWVYK